MMKRVILAATLACALALGGCMASTSTAPEATPSPAPTEAPAEIPMEVPGEEEVPAADEALSATVDLIYEKQPVQLMMAPVTAVDLTNGDWLSYNTGLSTELADKVDAAVISESMTGSQAYSLVVLRLKDTAAAQEIAQTMLDNIDPAKWVCVMADQQLVSVYGDTVVYCMSDSNLIEAQKVMDAADQVLGEPDFRTGILTDLASGEQTILE